MAIENASLTGKYRIAINSIGVEVYPGDSYSIPRDIEHRTLGSARLSHSTRKALPIAHNAQMPTAVHKSVMLVKKKDSNEEMLKFNRYHH